MAIQWFPGHMAKAITKLKQTASKIDALIEIVDARAPRSTRNPLLTELFPRKPRLVILNKSDLADESAMGLWINQFKTATSEAIAFCSQHQQRTTSIELAIHRLVSSQRSRSYVHAAVFGIPNVGKSTFINCLFGKKSLNVGNKPGVTKNQTWQIISPTISLLDTPGILWPKIESESAGFILAALHCIKESIYHNQDICYFLFDYLQTHYPSCMANRFQFDPTLSDPETIFSFIGQSRGCILKNKTIDLDRTYLAFLNDFRSGKLGKLSLEKPS